MGLYMNRRLFFVLVSAFLVAAACSYLVYRVVGNRLGAVAQKTTRVIVAVNDVKLGSVLKDADLATTDIVVGRGVVSDLYQGEPILESRLAAVGSGGGLAATIRQGMRACAVKVDEVVGVAGFVTPGMRVDILITGLPPGPVNPSEGTKVKTLLQNIEVLSAGTDIQKDGEGKPQQVQVVNLLVTPEQAEILSLASNQTHIQLVLRNPLDTQFAKTTGTAVGNLFSDGAVKPKPPLGRKASPPPPARLFLVEIFNGSKKTEAKFGADEAKQ
jgi:pilus assembly protein CpaB